MTTAIAKERTAFSLAAAAVIGTALEGAGTIDRISIKPNCRVQGFVTMNRRDRLSTSELRSSIVTNLAAVAAEDVSGGRTTSSAGALQLAHARAKRLAELEIVDRPDNFITGTLDSGMERARVLVGEHRASIDALTALLVEKGEIGGAELQDFMASHVVVAAGSVADIPRYCS